MQSGSESRIVLRAREYRRLQNAARDAHYDDLTRLLNRRGFRVRHQELCRRFLAGHEPTYAFVFIDIKKFKLINDRRGETRGDEALADFAQHLRRVVKHTDVVARVGGDEFAVIVRAVTPAQLEGVMKRLKGPFPVVTGRRCVRLQAYVVGRVATRQTASCLETKVHHLLVREKKKWKRVRQELSSNYCDTDITITDNKQSVNIHKDAHQQPAALPPKSDN